MSHFSEAEWGAINAYLTGMGEQFGLPEVREDSVVLASFNIRKLGKIKNRSKQGWEFLRNFCSRCDLIAVQEVLDDLEGLSYLKGLLGQDYGMAASDITGRTPGGEGMAERLAFLFRWKTIERTEIASDISYDRSAVIDTLYEKRKNFSAAFKTYTTKVSTWKKKKKKGEEPVLVLPAFVTFIRTPYCVSFRIPGLADAAPYEFLLVTAHLLYGDEDKHKEEREMEFEALMKWLIGRAKQASRMYHKNIILFGDLNLDFKDADPRREVINNKIKKYNSTILKSSKAAKVNFPFLDVHPGFSEVFRTNARQDETYDQIGFFNHDRRLPDHKKNETAGSAYGEFNYGMFNFADLFSYALYDKSLRDLSGTNHFKTLISKFEHDVSDHMPIWVRLPKPYPGQEGS